VKITAYNHHRSAPFFRALVVHQLPSLLGGRSRQRHSISKGRFQVINSRKSLQR
jgi:hypothetical protein